MYIYWFYVIENSLTFNFEVHKLVSGVYCVCYILYLTALLLAKVSDMPNKPKHNVR